MEGNFKVLCHSSIKIMDSKTMYFDPFKINENFNDADYIFCTHSHYDHFSPEDINKVKRGNTKLIVTEDVESEAIKLARESNVIVVKPNREYKIDNLIVKTMPAYNKTKHFHPKENNWVGYIVESDNKKYYIAGDTDNIEELHGLKCDIAFLPVGGTYTMNCEEAVELANKIDSKVFVPTHYGEIVGAKEDGKKFLELLNR